MWLPWDPSFHLTVFNCRWLKGITMKRSRRLEMTRWSDDPMGWSSSFREVWKMILVGKGVNKKKTNIFLCRWMMKKHHLKVPRFVQLKWFRLAFSVGLDSTDPSFYERDCCLGPTAGHPVTLPAGLVWPVRLANSCDPGRFILVPSLKLTAPSLWSPYFEDDSLPFGQSLPILPTAFCC